MIPIVWVESQYCECIHGLIIKLANFQYHEFGMQKKLKQRLILQLKFFLLLDYFLDELKDVCTHQAGDRI